MHYRYVNSLRRVVWRYPSLYRLIGILRRGADVNDLNYDVTVEGYPRSANTYAAELLKQTQPALRVRSHRHIPPHVAMAVEAKLPTLFLIRKPMDCITSYAILKQTCAREQLFYYIAYHQVLQRYIDSMFIVDFTTMIEVPKAVLEMFGRRYKIPIDVSFDLQKVQVEVFREMDRINTLECGTVNEHAVNRPVESRAELKLPLIAELNSARNRPRLEQAEALYERFLRAAISIPVRPPLNAELLKRRVA